MSRTIEELERKIKRQEERLNLLEGILLDGKPYTPGPEEYYRVLGAIEEGDWKPWIEWKGRGGVYPIERPCRMKPAEPMSFKPRKREARSLFPPETEANPATTTAGMLQDAKRGTLARHRRTARPEPSGNDDANAQRTRASGNDIFGNPATDPRISCGVAAGRDRHSSLSSGAAFGQPERNQVGYASP